MKNLWNRLFLAERPSIAMGLFRIAVALTVGFHVLPTFFALKENYLAGSFRILNPIFFTPGVLDWVQKSPDALVIFMVFFFCLFWFFYLIGFLTQLSCVAMTLGCYYFYALNNYAVGTLSWDILLVTLFLMCLTPYAGDYWSLDTVFRKDPLAYKRSRPFFLQRLLQMQVAFIYFYTGLYKITADGNWLTDNPLYYVILSPGEGVTKYFLFRDIFMAHPAACYVLGVLIVIIELSMPFLLFNPGTRVTAIYLGFLFHLTLLLTLDVPAIFFFLFPPQLLLFISPEKIVAWIEERRELYRKSVFYRVVYDGDCGFCSNSVRMLKVMDLLGRLEFVDFRAQKELKDLHPKLDAVKARSQLFMITSQGELFGGFFAFRRMTLLLPMMYPLILLFYFPGAAILGPWVYAGIAKNRFLLHFNKKCTKNECLR